MDEDCPLMFIKKKKDCPLMAQLERDRERESLVVGGGGVKIGVIFIFFFDKLFSYIVYQPRRMSKKMDNLL